MRTGCEGTIGNGADTRRRKQRSGLIFPVRVGRRTDTERMTDALKELYGFRNLEGHKLYWDQTVMQMDFHFNEDVTYSELDSARYFVLDK